MFKTYSKRDFIKVISVFPAVAVFIVAPIFLVLLSSVFIEGSLNLLAPIKVIMESCQINTYFNTILLGVYVVIGASVIALPAAFLMAKTDLGKHKWIDIVLLIPFMTPPYIGSMGWILFIQPRGFLNQLLPFSEGIDKVFFSIFGMILVMSLHIFPFAYLIIKNTLLRIGSSLEAAAAVHGGGMYYRLVRIVTPLLFSSYVMGILLIFVKTISEFGTPATLGRRAGFYVLTTEIHKAVSSWPISFSRATSLSSVLLATCIFVWYLQSVISSKFTYETVSGKGIKSGKIKMGLCGKTISWVYMLLLMAISVGIPYFSIIMTSLMKLRGYGLQTGNFTFMHYQKLFQANSQSLNAFLTSLGIAILTATICAVLGTFLGVLIMKYRGILSKVLDIGGMLPNAVPAIVVVIGLILFWNAPWMKIPIYNTFWMVVLTFAVLFIPYTIQYVKSSFGQLDPSLMQAGRVLGGSEWYVTVRILLPLLMPGIAAGWTMTFIIAFRELVAPLMILPPSMQTSSTYIFAQFEQGEASMGMAMAVISVAITVIVLTVWNMLLPSQERSDVIGSN